jgi:hypothetical protein
MEPSGTGLGIYFKFAINQGEHMTEGEVLEVLVQRCKELGTVARMNTAVLSQVAKRLAAVPGMTADKVMAACRNPMAMAKYF